MAYTTITSSSGGAGNRGWQGSTGDYSDRPSLRSGTTTSSQTASPTAKPKRTNEQNRKFHAICADFARSNLKWAGKVRDAHEWKVLLISGHAVATGQGAEIIAGLEGEFVNVRESSAKMNKARGSSLIEYAIAFAVTAGVQLAEYEGMR